MTSYRNIRARVKRLSEDLEALLRRCDDLEESNRKLRTNEETYELRDQARDRILTESLGLPSEIDGVRHIVAVLDPGTVFTIKTQEVDDERNE